LANYYGVFKNQNFSLKPSAYGLKEVASLPMRNVIRLKALG